MKCLVAGATGFVGSNLVSALVKKGFQVRALVRDNNNKFNLKNLNAEIEAFKSYEKGLQVVIVNPSTPVGPGDIKPTPSGKIIVDFLNRKIPAYIKTGLNLISVEDCVAGHILALEKGKPGERYILGNQNLSFHQILLLLEKITSLKAPKFIIPYSCALMAAYVNEAISNFITWIPPIPLGAVKMAKYFMYFDSSKAVRELGLPQNSIKKALENAVTWHRANGYAPC